MDSKLDEPELIGEHNDLYSYLENSVKCKDKELFIIVSKDIDSDGTWRNIN
jgi:josephin